VSPDGSNGPDDADDADDADDPDGSERDAAAAELFMCRERTAPHPS
jgi:hypothetical protein